MQGIALPKGLTVTSITWVSGTTALVTGTHGWSALYDDALGLLRQSTDDTSVAWAANTVKTFTLSSTFVTTYSGLHYLGLLITASTVPTMSGAGTTTTIISNIPPIIGGNSTTGLTGTAPNPAAAITINNGHYYANVS
jgi:hypothetical protein